MAIYHLSVKPVSRSAGRSATAAAAYRAGCKITDERTGEIHDYTRKGGVESADIVLPDGAPEWATDRAKLWNAAELAEKRKDACVAREFEVALPSELSPAERRRLALDFAKDMANREGCAVDVAIHAPGKEGDNRNHHAHILRTTRKVEAEGLGAKLDTEKAGRKRSDDLEAVRSKWADMTNERLRENGIAARVDHRSLEAQGIDREPTKHLGPAASGYERRTGQPSDKRIQQEREAVERLARAKEAGELERQAHQVGRFILDLSGNLAAAKAERDRPPVRAAGPDPRSAYHPDNIAKRAAQEAATPAKPVHLTALERFELAQAEKKRLSAASLATEARKVAPPPPQKIAPPAFDAPAKKAQWEALLKAERTAYLAELTAQAHAKAVAGVAEHQAHVDAKPLLLGRQKWTEQKERFEHRDGVNRLEWQNLKDGRYPFLTNDQEAVQKAIERRVGDKNPELARDMPEVESALLEARRQAVALEREQQAKKQVERELAAVPQDFKAIAAKREAKANGWSDQGDHWQAAPQGLRKLIDGYNAAPKEMRPAILARISSDSGRGDQVRELMAEQRQQYRENDQGISR